MKFSKIFNEYSKNSYNDYYYDMYGYGKNKEKEEKLEKEEAEINDVIEKYLDDIYEAGMNRLISKYREAINKTPRDDSKIEGIEKDIEHMITAPLQKLKRNRRAYKKAIDDDIIYNFDKFKNEFVTPLTESFLNIDEKNLIFGSVLENIKDLLLVEEVSESTKLRRIGMAVESEFKAKTPEERQKLRLNRLQQQKEYSDSQKQKEEDPLPIKKLTEADEISAAIATLDKQKNNLAKKINNVEDRESDLQDQKSNFQDQISKIQERKERIKQYDDMKDKLEKTKSITENNKEIVSTSKNVKEVLKKEDIESLDEGFARISPDLREEKMTSKDLRDEKKVSKDLRDEKILNKRPTSQYDTMLYNGASGEVLKYMVNGEINNNNVDVLEISKLVEKDGEAQIVLKKIKELLNKASKKELSYEEYTQLKVLKSQFKSIFTKFKNQYNNRYKN